MKKNLDIKFKYYIFFIIIILITARIALPYIALDFLKTEINKNSNYSAQIKDFDISIWRGKYTLRNIKIFKKNSPSLIFQAKSISFSLLWKSLIHGKPAGNIKIDNPIINIKIQPGDQEQPLDINQLWSESRKYLFPHNINLVEIHNGSLLLTNVDKDFLFTFNIKQIEFKLENSRFEMKGKAMENANVNIKGRYNSFAKSPTFQIKASLQSLNLLKLNPFLEHYTSLKAKSGNFSLFFEASAANGKITGYAKPFLKNFEVEKREDDSAIQKIYESVVSTTAKILKNPEKQSIATQVKIKGNIDDPDADTLSIIFYLFHHAFAQALIPKIDQKTSMQDVTYPPKNLSKTLSAKNSP